jgi:hypothetical protein
MAKLALVPLLAIAGLVEHTKHRLGIDAKRHLLRLHRLKECGLFLLALLLFEFFLGTQLTLTLLSERLARFACLRCLLLDTGNLFLDLGRFIFLITKRKRERGREFVIVARGLCELFLMPMTTDLRRKRRKRTFFIPKVYIFLDR